MLTDGSGQQRTLSARCSSLMAASSCLCARSSSLAEVLWSFFISFSIAFRVDMLGGWGRGGDGRERRSWWSEEASRRCGAARGRRPGTPGRRLALCPNLGDLGISVGASWPLDP